MKTNKTTSVRTSLNLGREIVSEVVELGLRLGLFGLDDVLVVDIRLCLVVGGLPRVLLLAGCHYLLEVFIQLLLLQGASTLLFSSDRHRCWVASLKRGHNRKKRKHQANCDATGSEIAESELPRGEGDYG